jgi:BlaI family transcriptional regulator, penicillinase repressor
MRIMKNSVDISHAEFEVLDALWQEHPATANEIIERLNQKKQWHDKTVKTLLNRLVKKEAINFEKEQRRYLYFPLVEREAYTQSESQSLIERMFSGRVSPLIAGFAKHKNLQKDDIEELKKIISSWEQENDD